MQPLFLLEEARDITAVFLTLVSVGRQAQTLQLVNTTPENSQTLKDCNFHYQSLAWWSRKWKTWVTVVLGLRFLTVQSTLFLKSRFSNILNKIQRQILLTRFSTSLSSSRNLSSSFTHCGNSFSPWLWACSNCSFSSLSTEISWTSRSCQVFEACRSSSRSSEVRIRRSVPKDLIEGWKGRSVWTQWWELFWTTPPWRAKYIMRPFFSRTSHSTKHLYWSCFPIHLKTKITNSSKSYR